MLLTFLLRPMLPSRMRQIKKFEKKNIDKFKLKMSNSINLYTSAARASEWTRGTGQARIGIRRPKSIYIYHQTRL